MRNERLLLFLLIYFIRVWLLLKFVPSKINILKPLYFIFIGCNIKFVSTVGSFQLVSISSIIVILRSFIVEIKQSAMHVCQTTLHCGVKKQNLFSLKLIIYSMLDKNYLRLCGESDVFVYKGMSLSTN